MRPWNLKYQAKLVEKKERIFAWRSLNIKVQTGCKANHIRWKTCYLREKGILPRECSSPQKPSTAFLQAIFVELSPPSEAPIP